MTTIINLNKHEIVVQLDDGSRKTFEGTKGTPATVAQTNVVGEPIDGIPTVSIEYGDLIGVPEPQDGVIYLVNMLVLAQAKKQGRTDCVSPDSGATAIRFPKGHTVNGREMGGQIDAVIQFSV